MSDVATPTGETENEKVHGTVSNDETTQKTEQNVESPEIAAMRAELEAEKKARQQADMRANQLKNKQDETERARLEQEGKWQEAYELERQKTSQLEAEQEAQREANRSKAFRDAQINAYENEKVRDVAKKLVSKNPSNFGWTEGASESQAAQELKDQLDALNESLGGETNVESESANALNPNPRSVEQPKPAETREQAAERLHKAALRAAGF